MASVGDEVTNPLLSDEIKPRYVTTRVKLTVEEYDRWARACRLMSLSEGQMVKSLIMGKIKMLGN